jgi:hypothetical protein
VHLLRLLTRAAQFGFEDFYTRELIYAHGRNVTPDRRVHVLRESIYEDGRKRFIHTVALFKCFAIRFTRTGETF